MNKSDDLKYQSVTDQEPGTFAMECKLLMQIFT